MVLLLTFAQNLGLEKELERRGYEVSALLLSFIRLIIQGGDRLNDLEMLEADPDLKNQSV
jgi:hypothetical protein